MGHLELMFLFQGSCRLFGDPIVVLKLIKRFWSLHGGFRYPIEVLQLI